MIYRQAPAQRIGVIITNRHKCAVRFQHLFFHFTLLTGHRRDFRDRRVYVAAPVASLKELIKAHGIEQAINTRVGAKNSGPKVEALFGLNRQLGEHAEGGAIEPVGLGHIHPHAHKIGLGKHRLKVLVQRSAHSQTHVALELQHVGALVGGRQLTSDFCKLRRALILGLGHDAVVVGSGFGGALVARELVAAGLNTALLERGHWLRQAPFLAHRLELALPTQNLFGQAYYRLGLGMYDALSGQEGIGASRLLSEQDLRQALPQLQPCRGAVAYSDGQFNDARLNLLIALTAKRSGALLRTRSRVVGFERDSSGQLSNEIICTFETMSGTNAVNRNVPVDHQDPDGNLYTGNTVLMPVI